MVTDEQIETWRQLVKSGEAAIAVAEDPSVLLPMLAEIERLRGIVRDLAECLPTAPSPPDGDLECALCDYHEEKRPEHSESCPWRRAVEAMK